MRLSCDELFRALVKLIPRFALNAGRFFQAKMSSDDSLALALKLQAEEDAKLAQQEHDEGVAEAHGP